MSPTPEAPPTRRGGRRPGAGAPRGNTNAARKTPRRAVLNVFRGAPFQTLRRSLPPALAELLTMALAQATHRALAETEADALDLTPTELDRAQRRALALAGQLVIAAFAEAWSTRNRSHTQREAAAVSVLRTWLRDDIRPEFKPNRAIQSKIESAAAYTIEHNQTPPPGPNPRRTPRTATSGPSPSRRAPASLPPDPHALEDRNTPR